VQGSEFFYLDPHQTQPAIPYREKVDEYTETDINSCHTRRLRKLHVKELDPSMLLGFLIQSEDGWNQWCQSISQLPGKSIVHIAPRDPTKHGLHADDEAAVNAVESFDEYDDDDDDTKDQDSDVDDAGDADAVLV
jgi:cysteine protease ATG4